jgi:flagellar biosynthesis protein FlhF
MTVKTLTASTIAAALAEARRQFGEDVVLLESAPPFNGKPARITIMADAPESLVEAAPQTTRVAAPRVATRQPAAVAAYGYAGTSLDFLVEDDSDVADESAAGSRRASGRPRGALFPSTKPSDSRSLEAREDETRDNLESLLNNRLEGLFDRLSGIEKRFDGFPAAAARYQRHPLFNRLIDRGLKPETVTELFTRCADIDQLDDDAIFWALARELRTMLAASAPTRMSGTQVVIGHAGSGKTSLALRLVRDNGFFGRRKAGVIVIATDDDLNVFGNDPVAVFHRYGVPVQTVGSAAEMETALQRLSGFDQIIIDTPALPRDARSMKEATTRLRSVVTPVVPSQVLMVVDATSALEDVDVSAFRHSTLSPDAFCLTRMDEVARPGRVAEWMRKSSQPVNVLGCGRSVTNALSSFSPAAFAEQLLSR